MNSPKVFLSYARTDLDFACQLERSLDQNGISVWRDQESLYGGQQWPKAIGEAIASTDFLLLVWSQNSAQSYYVEFEWSTAIALRKSVLPCLLDNSPLPPSLAAVNGISLANFEEGCSRILRSLQIPVSGADPKHKQEVLKQLEMLQVTQPYGVVQAATTMFLQRGWTGFKKEPTLSPTGSSLLLEGVEMGRRYKVIGLLGKGGMGAVYRARDTELDREVALKLIRADLAQNPEAVERFKREIQISSAVTHKNVLRVYDLGENDGIKFLTMQYVDGEDLAGLIKREGALPVQRLLDIFQQTCRGLAAAHERGILHRDLKPQNLMIDRAGTVYLTDFGLAKAAEQDGLTQTGALMGTPFYMAPEQVKGEEFDQRSDLYSLGVILYEMLTGQLPFQGKSTYDILFRRVQGPPRPAKELRPDIPVWLHKILDRCLAIDRSARYASADEILADIDKATAPPVPKQTPARPLWQRVLLVSVMVIVLAVAGYWVYLRGRAVGPQEVPEVAAVIAIVPFENRTGDAKLDWYGEGIARLVMDSLAQSRHVQVASAARVQELLSKSKDRNALARTAEAGGIGYILSGDIMNGPGGLTVAVRVSETKQGRETVAKRIDNLTPQTLIGASDQIALAAKVGLGIPSTESVDVFAANFASKNPAAYQLYLEGLRAFDQYHHSEAERKFKAALEKSPDYTMARYRLAYVMADQGRTDEALTEIKRALSEVSSVSDREARYIKAAEAYFSRRYDDAVKQYKGLVDRYPFEIEARRLVAEILYETRNYQESIKEAQMIARLSPESHVAWSILGLAHLALRNVNEAVNDFKRYVELEPNSANAHHLMADAYRVQGEYDRSAAEYTKALAIDPTFHYSTTALAVVDFLRGQPDKAERGLMTLISDTRAMPRQRIDAAFELAFLRRAVGRFREAAFILETFDRPIESEKVRQAHALSIRGASFMECGDFDQARRLIDLAVVQAPAVPTRHLFARGLLELKQNKLEDARKTASLILEKEPPTASDKTSEKAAGLIRGKAFLQERNTGKAIEELSKAVSLPGFEYGIYCLELARAYLAAGKVNEALASARQAAAPIDPASPRLDAAYTRLELETDRARAHLLLAQVLKANKQPTQARSEAQGFLKRWESADVELSELSEARQLATGSEIPQSGQ